MPALTFAYGDLVTAPAQTDVLVPEALLHYQLGRGQFRPYVGGGAGAALINLLDRTINGVATVASGLPADLGPGSSSSILGTELARNTHLEDVSEM